MAPADLSRYLLKLKARGNLPRDAELLLDVVLLDLKYEDFVQCLEDLEVKGNLAEDYAFTVKFLKACLPVEYHKLAFDNHEDQDLQTAFNSLPALKDNMNDLKLLLSLSPAGIKPKNVHLGFQLIKNSADDRNLQDLFNQTEHIQSNF